MASGTSPSSAFTAQTTSIAQPTLSSTSASVLPEGPLEIFAYDQIHDFYNNGYSQDEADIVTLFFGKLLASMSCGIFQRLTLNLNSERSVRCHIPYRVYSKSIYSKA
jgi:hypothetical protein